MRCRQQFRAAPPLHVLPERRRGPQAREPFHVWLLHRFGVPTSTALILVAGFCTSLVVMWPINTLTHGSLFTGVVVTTVLCTLVLPYPIYKILRLIDTLERTRRDLLRVSITDDLTGAYNRGYFIGCLEAACREALAQEQWLAVVFFDIDSFKIINDTYGHDGGDAVLRAVARACQAHVRHDDVFARYGGEEFAFILPATTAEGARAFAERICRQIAACQIEHRGRSIPCTASFGVTARKGATSFEELLVTADRALYQAKAAGKNRVIASTA